MSIEYLSQELCGNFDSGVFLVAALFESAVTSVAATSQPSDLVINESKHQQ